MTGGDVDLLECVELPVFLVPAAEDLPVLAPAQFLQDLVVPEPAAFPHVAVHLILLYNSSPTHYEIEA